MILFPMLLFLNGLSEYLLNRMMAAMGVPDPHTEVSHAVRRPAHCLDLFGAILLIPLPVQLIGLLFLLFLNVLPYGPASDDESFYHGHLSDLYLPC